MCSGSVEGSCLRLIDFVYHSTLGLRVIKRFRCLGLVAEAVDGRVHPEPREPLGHVQPKVLHHPPGERQFLMSEVPMLPPDPQVQEFGISEGRGYGVDRTESQGRLGVR